jgi:hypothetical protein
MPQLRWMWLITTPTFQPSFSRAALFLPFHIFFYNLIGLFVLRNARNQHWSGEHACSRLRVKPLDPESGSYQGECWRRRRRVLVCSKLFTVTCLVTCPSWGRSHRNLWKPQNLKISESQNPREFWVWGRKTWKNGQFSELNVFSAKCKKLVSNLNPLSPTWHVASGLERKILSPRRPTAAPSFQHTWGRFWLRWNEHWSGLKFFTSKRSSPR